MSKITVRTKHFTIHKENDGLFGKGVDLYLGFLVFGSSKSFGGTSKVSKGMKKSNGNSPSHKNKHIRNETLFSFEIEENAATYTAIRMIESDRDTKRIMARYKEAKLPNLDERAWRGNFSITLGHPILMIKDAIATVGNVLNNLFRGRIINTDDDYGGIDLVMVNDAGALKVSLAQLQPNCTGRILNEQIEVDGKWSDLATMNFKTKKNNVSVVFEFKAN